MNNNYIGKKITRLTIISDDPNKKGYYICDCDCGTKGKSISAYQVRKGIVKSCGCYNSEVGHNRAINLAGKKFGNFLVIERDNTKQNKVYWKCKCLCGSIISVESYRLRNGLISNCGCKKVEEKNKIIGMKIGLLTIVGYSDKTTKKGEHYIICDCDCGTKGKLVLKNALFNKNPERRTISCGCYVRNGLHVKERTKEDRIMHIQEYLYGKLKIRNKKLGFDNHEIISFDNFISIINEPCYYCGLIETDTSMDTKSKRIVNNDIIYKPVTGTIYKHNGIDRIDSNKGYVVDNVIPCCKYCNIAKSDMTQKEFYDWIESVYNYYLKKEHI